MNIIPQVLARIENPVLTNPEHSTNPVGFTQNALSVIISIFFIVGVIYFLWHFLMGAFHMIANDGDSKQIETARHELTYSFLGVLIVFSVFAVLKLVGWILGIDGLENLQITFPTL